jgi:hypothetical protein
MRGVSRMCLQTVRCRTPHEDGHAGSRHGETAGHEETQNGLSLRGCFHKIKREAL